jgi:hypothetical protein
MRARGTQKTLLSVKIRRKSAKFLSLSELTKLRNNGEIEVSKGKVPLFGRRTDEICLGRAKVCCDLLDMRKNVGVIPLSSLDFASSEN